MLPSLSCRLLWTTPYHELSQESVFSSKLTVPISEHTAHIVRSRRFGQDTRSDEHEYSDRLTNAYGREILHQANLRIDERDEIISNSNLPPSLHVHTAQLMGKLFPNSFEEFRKKKECVFQEKEPKTEKAELEFAGLEEKQTQTIAESDKASLLEEKDSTTEKEESGIAGLKERRRRG